MWGMGNNSNNNPNYNHHNVNINDDMDHQRLSALGIAQLAEQQQQQVLNSYPNISTNTNSDLYNSAAFQQYQQVHDSHNYSHQHSGHNHSHSSLNHSHNGSHSSRSRSGRSSYSDDNLMNVNMSRSQQHAASSALLEERHRVELALAANALQEEAQVQAQREVQMREARAHQMAYEREVLAASEQMVRERMMAQELAASAANDGGSIGSGNDMDMNMSGMNMHVNMSGMNNHRSNSFGGGGGNASLGDYSNSHSLGQQQSMMEQERESASQYEYMDEHAHARHDMMGGRRRSNSMSDSIGSAPSRDLPVDGSMFGHGHSRGRSHDREHSLSRGHSMMDSIPDVPSEHLLRGKTMRDSHADVQSDDDVRSPARSRAASMDIGFGREAEPERPERPQEEESPIHKKKMEPEVKIPTPKKASSKKSTKAKSESAPVATPKKEDPSVPSPDSPLGIQVPASPIVSSSQTSSKKKKKATPSSNKDKDSSNNSSSKKGGGSAKKTPSKRTPKKAAVISLDSGSMPNLNSDVPPITKEEYANLDQLMTQFCKAPLLAEFSRPVSLLHPELSSLYHKVVLNPIDLGKVCRAIRRRQYTDVRQVCVDVWRIFSNCVKYHTHPITREGAIPSFVSIANHLREYFNALWMEYMLPSEINSSDKNKDSMAIAMKNADEKRSKVRRDRYNGVLTIVLSNKLLEKVVSAIESFVEMGGRVDALDKDSILNDDNVDEDETQAVEAAFAALTQLTERLSSIANSEYEYTVESLVLDLKRCYSDEVFEGFPRIKVKFERRLDRIVGKLLVPVNEVSCRGVNQSSVWGCMAAAIWARETTKRPYWPALVLGIMAPEDQKEDWHDFLTVRNEERLPEKLQAGLQAGKKKATQAIAKQNSGNAERMSYFLVEFLGTHEFIWVKEADIIENFDPEEDVNQQPGIGSVTKKKKSSLRGQTAANAKMLHKATDEGRWALEEFEMLLNDPCGDQMDMEFGEEEEEENYTFPVLCESDDEADEADNELVQDDKKKTNVFNSPTGVVSALDEINELIATDGKVDFSAEGKKNAKKRAAALKKQKAAEIKKEKAAQTKKKQKSKSSRSSKEDSKKSSKHESEMKKEQKELEKRRKKRGRERERVIKEEERKAKKNRTADGSSVVRRGRKLGIADKRGRAANIVRGYINRIAIRDGMKGLGLGGVTTLPAASVEGSGLLGLALAFRAAAGELEMPNSDDSPSNMKPWDRIDAQKPLKSADRCKALEQQIELLEKAIQKLDGDDDRRRKYIQIANQEREDRDKAILEAEKEARQNDMPKRKVSVKRKISIDKPDPVKKEADEDEVKNDESPDVAVKTETMTDAGDESDQEAVPAAPDSEMVNSESVIPEIEAIQAEDTEEF